MTDHSRVPETDAPPRGLTVMPTGRRRDLAPRLALALALLAASGCSQPGPFLSRGPTVGSLKASVSNLEFENEKLRREVGELKADNARLDNEIAQERDANGEITARLDDAKQLLRQNGGTAQAFGASNREVESDIPPPVSTSPSRRVKAQRKPPAAEIPRMEPSSPFGQSGDSFGYQPADPRNRERDRDRDLGTGDQVDDRWLPVARGMGTPVVRQ